MSPAKRPIESLRNIAEIVQLSSQHQTGDWLFRGQRTEDEPVPKVFRRDTCARIAALEIKCGLEPMLGHEFRDYAHSVGSLRPMDEEHFEWLALMQHHGAPTRLLDWTRGILVAAYFAVEFLTDCDECKDGAIWVLNSGALTETTREAHRPGKRAIRCSCLDRKDRIKGTPFSVIKAAKLLAEQAFADHQSRKKKPCKVNDTCRFPLVVAPPRTFARLVTQRAWFTIHPTPATIEWATPRSERFRRGEGTLKLTEIMNMNRSAVLRRYIIPADNKREIRHALDSMGINRATLFPDLDGLGQSLIPQLQRRFRT